MRKKLLIFAPLMAVAVLGTAMVLNFVRPDTRVQAEDPETAVNINAGNPPPNCPDIQGTVTEVDGTYYVTRPDPKLIHMDHYPGTGKATPLEALISAFPNAPSGTFSLPTQANGTAQRYEIANRLNAVVVLDTDSSLWLVDQMSMCPSALSWRPQS